ncbi:hypothetical protein [Capnocytophaga canis]|uniref:hypothetical protein n=1 Tax=Capnocytophaga canis TaxID=1848903 RepID=UPI0016032DF8|nr:hypothetical protein [Capnocytophaga canis]
MVLFLNFLLGKFTRGGKPFLIMFIDDSGNGFPIDDGIDLCVKRAFSGASFYIVSSKGQWIGFWFVS